MRSLCGRHNSSFNDDPSKNQRIKALLLYLFTGPRGSRHNGFPLTLTLRAACCWTKAEHREISPDARCNQEST